MNLEKSGRKLVVVAAVAMLAMVVQGCGGDDGVSQSRFDEEVAKTAAAEKARMEAEAAKTKADADKAAADKAKMDAEAAKTKAEADKAAAEKAAETDKTATETANTAAQADRTAAQTALDQAAADKMRADKLQAAQEKRNKEKELRDANWHRQIIRLNRKYRWNDGGHPAPRTVTPPTTTPATTYSPAQAAALTLTRDLQDPTKLKLTSSTLRAEFAGYDQATDRLLSALTGWDGVMLEGKMNKEDKIAVYSNQRNNKVALSSLYNRVVPPGQTVGHYLISSDGSNKSFTFGASGNVKGDPGQMVTTTGGTTNTLTGKVLGTIPGTFTCTGAAAAVGTAACGYLASGSGPTLVHTPNHANWTFTPTNADAMTYKDYFYFGWWLNHTMGARTTRQGGNVGEAAGQPDRVAPAPDRELPNFDVFYRYVGKGMLRTGDSDVANTSLKATGADLKGTATYMGPAAGMYAIRSDLAGGTSEAGNFTAQARLTLNFDADRYEPSTGGNPTRRADTDGISLDGTIDNFKTSNSLTISNAGNWKVKLTADGEGGNAATTGIQPLRHLGYKGSTAGGGTAGGGANLVEWALDGETYVSFQAIFTPGSNQPSVIRGRPGGRFDVDFYGGNNNEVPESAVGAFAAEIDNLAVLMGAFAVEKQ